MFASHSARIKDALLLLVEREREGEVIDRSLIKGVLTIYVDVGMNSMTAYEGHFEAPLLAATHDYYERKAALWVQEDSCPDYLQKAEDCLLAEEDRADSYLHATTKKKLLDAAQARALSPCVTCDFYGFLLPSLTPRIACDFYGFLLLSLTPRVTIPCVTIPAQRPLAVRRMQGLRLFAALPNPLRHDPLRYCDAKEAVPAFL